MMASSMKLSVLMFLMLSIMFSVSSSSPSLSSRCYPQINPFLLDLQLQCPTTIVYSSSIEMDGESLDRLLSLTNAYTVILFYASWCPFSTNFQPKFDALASMYPQFKHVKVEQSSALPSVFSRYGIHTVPTVLIANRTSRVRYHGSKDLHSLLDFYKKTTGLEPTVYITEDQITSSSQNIPNKYFHSWNLTSLKNEPYLLFSLLFVLLQSFLFLFPDFVSNVIVLWVTYIPRLNLAIFGESKQLLTHALQLFDIKSAFRKLKLSKSRNLRNGARSARVLASSFASVSLGETSSERA